MRDRLDQACAIEETAWRDIFAAANAGGAAVRLSVQRVGAATALIAPGIDNLLFNRAFGVDDSALAAVVERYARAGVERYLLHAPPTRGDARSALDTHGAARLGVERFHRAWIKLAADLERPTRPRAVGALGGIEIGAARPSDALACARVLADGFELGDAAVAPLAALVGRQRWHVFAAYHDELPVAAGALFTDDRGGAYLAFAATRAAYRGRGLQQALLAARLQRARALGCRRVFSETGAAVPGERNSSQNNLERFGLRVVGSRENYAPTGTRWAA